MKDGGSERILCRREATAASVASFSTLLPLTLAGQGRGAVFNATFSSKKIFALQRNAQGVA